VIAEALGVPISALPSLVVVAEAKLAQLLSEPDPTEEFHHVGKRFEPT
jgi:hypothetical protein